jgi:putative transposase
VDLCVNPPRITKKKGHAMALDQSALLEVLEALKTADVDDRVRSAATTIYQALIEAELTAVIGAVPHERTDARTARRNGSRPRTLTTTAGDLEVRIPRSCGPGRSSPRCWSAGGGSTRRFSRW